MTQSSREVMIHKKEMIRGYKKKHEMHTDIIKTCPAHGDIRSRAAAAHVGYISFYIWRHNFFPERHSLKKVHFVFPGKFCIR